MSREDRPFGSVCRIPDGFLWVVFEDPPGSEEDAVRAWGRAPTEEEAVRCAREVGGKGYRLSSPTFARGFYYKHLAQDDATRFTETSIPFAFCACGKKRWFWCVWKDVHAMWGSGYRPRPGVTEPSAMLHAGERPHTCGYSPTWGEAEKEALAVAEGLATETGRIPQRCAASTASVYHRRLLAEKRMETRGSGGGATRLEFVYQPAWVRYGSFARGEEGKWLRYRIVKCTAKRVYVEAAHYTEQRAGRKAGDPQWYDYAEETFILDRTQLERDGCAWARGRHWSLYYLRPDLSLVHRQGCPALAVLGLDAGATTADVKRAFRRKSKEMHPDQGGDHESFIALQQAYEQALTLCTAQGGE